MNRNAIAVISSFLVSLSFAIAGSAYAQNPNEVSDDGGKTWHPYGESQDSGSSSSGMSEAERARGIDAGMRNGSPALRASFNEMDAGRRGDWNSAVRYGQEAVRLRPDVDAFRGNLALDQGHAAEAKEDWNSAIRYYQEAIRINGTNPFLQRSLAKAQAAAAATGKLEAVKAGSELRESDAHRFHFVKSKQLPPPPIARIDPKTVTPTVKRELDDYMQSWKASNQKYQNAPPEKAAQIKKEMVKANNDFKTRLKRDYAVSFQ